MGFVLFLAGLIASAHVRLNQSAIPVLDPSSQLQVTASDQACLSDTDCTIVSNNCSTCECGVPVNKIHEQKYVQKWSKQCEGYSGSACRYLCPTPYARCINNQCTLSGTMSGADESANWQTYHNEEHGFKLKYPGGWALDEVSPVSIELRDKKTDSQISIAVFDSSGIMNNLDVAGITFCGAYPEQCTYEDVEIHGTQTAVVWRPGNASTRFDLPGAKYVISISFEPVPREITPEVKALFRQILSTFKFIEP
jgi:hypothetical protein